VSQWEAFKRLYFFHTLLIIHELIGRHARKDKTNQVVFFVSVVTSQSCQILSVARQESEKQ
jgi:hypothetical protein